MVGVLAVALGTAAAARPVGRDGQVHACYRVKGKEKGSMRVVAGKHCRRGERTLSWSLGGTPGAPGAAGAQGSAGNQGSAGQPGSDGTRGSTGPAATVAALEDKISGLTGDVDNLEGTLDGITNDELKDALGTVDGITNLELISALGKLSAVSGADLEDAVGSLPAVETLSTAVPALQTQVNGLTTGLGVVEGSLGDVEGSLGDVEDSIGKVCEQAESLTSQVNLVGAALGEVELVGGLATLLLPEVAPLDDFACSP
jgi:hypothetical protein